MHTKTANNKQSNSQADLTSGQTDLIDPQSVDGNGDVSAFNDNTVDPMQSTSPNEEVLQAALEKITELALKLQEAEDARNRAIADYQNLVRRSKEDQKKSSQLATRDLTEDLLDHFDHLSMAAEHSKDSGLEMIINQMWQTLRDHGLVEIEVLGKPFDPVTMEAIESDFENGAESEKLVVTSVVKRGYALNGVVLRVATVMLGQ